MGSGRRLRAIATLIGTTIGAGIFGLPYAIAQVGWGAGMLMLIGLGMVTLVLNLAFGEVILRTKGDHQLSGYGEIYFGRIGRILGFAAVAIGAYGAMTAYIIQSGQFLALVLSADNTGLLSLAFFIAGSLAVTLGLKTVSEVELVLTTFMIALVGMIAVVGWPVVAVANLTWTAGQPDWLIPYGVIMFALAGSAVVPEIEEIIRQEHCFFRSALIWGTMVPTAVYLLFATAVIGICGREVTPDAIGGLSQSLPGWIVRLGALLGILTMGTSFTSLGYVLRELYFRDFKLAKPQALTLALVPSVAVFLLGVRSFISILEITGVIMGGLTGGLILMLFVKARREGTQIPAYTIPLPGWGVLTLMLLFLWGALAKLLR